MPSFRMKPKTERVAESLPIDLAEKDDWLGVVNEVETNKHGFQLTFMVFNDDGTQKKPRAGNEEKVEVTHLLGMEWANRRENILASLFPEMSEDGGDLELPDDLYERWALLKLGTQKQKEDETASSFMPRMQVRFLEIVPENLREACDKGAQSLFGRVRPQGIGATATADTEKASRESAKTDLDNPFGIS